MLFVGGNNEWSCSSKEFPDTGAKKANPESKVKKNISQAKKLFPTIMWVGVDWISCYYSRYKAEKASKKFEDWPWPDWE